MSTRSEARARGHAFAVLFAITMTAFIVWSARTAHAQEYVEICSLYGTGFHFVPPPIGEEPRVCLNLATKDAREHTNSEFPDDPPLVWRWRMPGNPLQPVPSARKHCRGDLVRFGTIDSSGLALNAYDRFETTSSLTLALEERQYVSDVVLRGGFSGVGRGDFCLFYRYTDPLSHTPASRWIGCADTAPQAGSSVPMAFVSDLALPPESEGDVTVFGANGDRWPVATPDLIGGSLEVWLCLKKART